MTEFEPIHEHLADSQTEQVAEVVQEAEVEVPAVSTEEAPTEAKVPEKDVQSSLAVPQDSSWNGGEATKQGPSGLELYVRQILAQVKAFFSADPANVYDVTEKSSVKLTWLFWFLLFLSSTEALLAPARFLLTKWGAWFPGLYYLATIFTAAAMFWLHFATSLVFAQLTKVKVPVMKLLDLTAVALMPFALFGLAPFIFSFIGYYGWIMLILPVIGLSEYLTHVLYRRYLNLEAQQQKFWLYFGASAARLFVTLLSAWIFTRLMVW